MATLRDSVSDIERKLFGFKNVIAAGLAINAGGATTFKTAAALSYTTDGIYKAKAALAAQAFTAGHATVNIGQTGYFVVTADGAGNIVTVQTVMPSGVSIAGLNDIPTGTTPIGIIKVVNTAAAGGFVPGTTALDGAGLTTTYFDVSLLPTNAP